MTNHNSLVGFKLLTTDPDGQKSKVAYEVPAVFLEKSGTFYLFFSEHGNGNITTCRFEMMTDSLRIRRNGEMVTEQKHILDKMTDGYIKTSFGHLDTQLMTTRLAFVNQGETLYKLNVKYNFYIQKVKSSPYKLDLDITIQELFPNDSTN